MRTGLLLLACVFAPLAWCGETQKQNIEPGPAKRLFGHGHDHSHDHDHHRGHHHSNHVHFDHPILTEVPTPHNVVSFGYSHTRSAEKSNSDEFEVGIEFAPVEWFSFEVAAPVELLNPDTGAYRSGLGNTEFAFKFASFHFDDKGIVLAAGLEMGLPTGDDDNEIGSNNEVELEPFVTLGWKHGNFELISVFGYGMAINRDKGEPFVPGFGYQLSALYHLNSKIAALCEFRGETELRGESRGSTVLEIAPGIKFKPWDSPCIEFGVNAVLPISDTREREWSVGFALFYHF